MTNEITTTQPIDLVLIAPLPLDRNPAAVYLAGLANDKARRVQKNALDTIAAMLTGEADCLSCNWAALRFQHTAAIRARLANEYSAASARRMVSAMRGALKAAWRLELMPADDYHRAVDLKPIRGETLPAGRALSPGEIGALMRSCENDPTPAGARDAALIACMYPGGLRRDEVTWLDLTDYDPQTGALTVRHGKGNKERVTYLVNGAMRAMADWLAIRGGEPGPLFWPVNKGGRTAPVRLSGQAMYRVLAKRGNDAGIANFSPHDLRRTFISDLLDAGADIATVAKLAGHADVATTARYDRRPEQAKQRAAGLLHLPYRGRLV